MNTDNCYVLFFVEYRKFHCTNPILYKKEKTTNSKQFQIKWKKLNKHKFWYLSHVEKYNKWAQKFLLINFNLVYETVYGF